MSQQLSSHKNTIALGCNSRVTGPNNFVKDSPLDILCLSTLLGVSVDMINELHEITKDTPTKLTSRVKQRHIFKSGLEVLPVTNCTYVFVFPENNEDGTVSNTGQNTPLVTHYNVMDIT